MPLDTEFPSGIRCPGPSGDTAADDQDRLCEYGGFTYSYNARGQLESRSDGAATTTYSYDGLGRLKRVTEPGMDLHYIHDALGRRIGKVRDGNLEKGWLYADALNPIAELDSSGNVEATFVYGTRAHVPDAMVMTDGTVYRFITDHLGSVRLVVNAETGQVVQRMDYDAFGRVLNDTNPGFQPFGFAGGLYDDDTALVRFGARDYDAYAGRWTAKDPIGFGGGDENLYAYVLNDPVNLLDPIGLAWYDYFDTGNDSGFMQAMNFFAGMADVMSWGLGGLARDAIFGGDDPINECGGAYMAGELAGIAASIVVGGANGIRAAGKAGPGLEFSHWIPKRLGGPRSILNGNFVSSKYHALSDPMRYRFMPRVWKAANPLPGAASRMARRLPRVVTDTVGMGASGGSGYWLNQAY